MDMTLTPALTIPHDDSRPGFPGHLEILGRRAKRAFTGRFNPLATHVALGRAAAVLDNTGFDWRQFSSVEDVVAKAEAVLAVAAHPLVAEHELPLRWLVGSDATPLGDTELKAIEQAIELANTLGEDWTEWMQKFTPAHVVVHELPRLIAKAETPAPTTRAKRPSRGQRIAARRQKALARGAEIAKPTSVVAVPAPQTHEPEVIKFTPGLVINKGGVPNVVCTGQNGKCLRLTPVSDARVGSIGSAKRTLGVRRWDEITEAHLASISFCEVCASRILAGGHQTIAEAIKAIAAKIVECETRQADEQAAREAARAQHQADLVEARARSERARQRARRAASGGAFGNRRATRR